MGKACSKHIEKWNAYGSLMGNPVERTPQEMFRYRWEYAIEMDLKGHGAGLIGH
jgi:hypothetical protein